MKTVSILIAAYKASLYIRETLQSIFDQELPPSIQLEILVGVDGCEDTWEELSTIRHHSLRKIRMDQNYGTYITFNTLLQQARGDYLVRFDADDVMHPDYLIRQIRIMEEPGGPDFTRCWTIYTNAYLTPIRARLADGSYTTEKGERFRGIDGQFMVRRSLMEKLGGLRPWPISADTEFVDRVKFLTGEIRETEEFLYMRRVHPGALTQQPQTGRQSSLRSQYNNKILTLRTQRLLPKDCHVVPETGKIRQIINPPLTSFITKK